MSKQNDEHWMRLALQLAEKGKYGVSPNPMVGACIVKKNKIVAQGYHERYGGEHAEVIALRNAAARAKDASLYVTLEPCSSWGKTPPCVAAILRSGIREVVIASSDPNPRHQGRGIRELKKNGIRVRFGVLRKEAEALNQSFRKWVTTGYPYVSVKMAQSLDGKIATNTGLSRWISSPASRQFVHELRAEQDAILVGKNTLWRDNPLLSPREKKKNVDPSKPWRVVISPDGKLPPNARVSRGPQTTMIAISQKLMKHRALLAKRTREDRVLLPIKDSKQGLDLKHLLKYLGSLGVGRLLVEGGGETVWSLLNEGLVDRMLLIIAPKIIGGRNAKTSVEGTGVHLPSRAFQFETKTMRPLGEDWLVELHVHRHY